MRKKKKHSGKREKNDRRKIIVIKNKGRVNASASEEREQTVAFGFSWQLSL